MIRNVNCQKCFCRRFQYNNFLTFFDAHTWESARVCTSLIRIEYERGLYVCASTYVMNNIAKALFSLTVLWQCLHVFVLFCARCKCVLLVPVQISRAFFCIQLDVFVVYISTSDVYYVYAFMYVWPTERWIYTFFYDIILNTLYERVYLYEMTVVGYSNKLTSKNVEKNSSFSPKICLRINRKFHLKWCSTKKWFKAD